MGAWSNVSYENMTQNQDIHHFAISCVIKPWWAQIIPQHCDDTHDVVRYNIVSTAGAADTYQRQTE
jgi:hypothetical protein